MLIISASSTEQASHDNQNLLSLAKAKICLLALIDCLKHTHAAATVCSPLEGLVVWVWARLRVSFLNQYSLDLTSYLCLFRKCISCVLCVPTIEKVNAECGCEVGKGLSELCALLLGKGWCRL
jgi:hypothetical protein